MKIKTTFLQHASDILGDTNSGLTSTQIVKFFTAKSVDYDVDIPHTTVPFDAPNKRTALFDNLLKFSNDQQFEIIEELCDFYNIDSFKELKARLYERYGDKSDNGSSTREVKPKAQDSNTQRRVKTFNEFTESNSTTNPNSMPHIQSFDEFTNTTNSKKWWKKPKYFVPILAAFIIGLFTLLASIIDKPIKMFKTNENCDYQIILIDKATEMTPVFKSTNPRVRIYISTPPMIERIIDGSVCIKTDKNLEKEQILIELENTDNYRLLDRKQYFERGVMELYVVKNKE